MTIKEAFTDLTRESNWYMKVGTSREHGYGIRQRFKLGSVKLETMIDLLRKAGYHVTDSTVIKPINK